MATSRKTVIHIFYLMKLIPRRGSSVARTRTCGCGGRTDTYKTLTRLHHVSSPVPNPIAVPHDHLTFLQELVPIPGSVCVVYRACRPHVYFRCDSRRSVDIAQRLVPAVMQDIEGLHAEERHFPLARVQSRSAQPHQRVRRITIAAMLRVSLASLTCLCTRML